MTKIRYFSILIFIFFGLALYGQHTGIGTINPTNTLHIVAPDSTANPLRIEFLQESNATTEPMIMIYNDSTGIVNYLSLSKLLEADRPKGIFKTIEEVEDSLQVGDKFIAHPQGTFGCGGCVMIYIKP